MTSAVTTHKMMTKLTSASATENAENTMSRTRVLSFLMPAIIRYILAFSHLRYNIVTYKKDVKGLK